MKKRHEKMGEKGVNKKTQKRDAKKKMHEKLTQDGSRWFLMCSFKWFHQMVSSPFNSPVSLNHLMVIFKANLFRLSLKHLIR